MYNGAAFPWAGALKGTMNRDSASVGTQPRPRAHHFAGSRARRYAGSRARRCAGSRRALSVGKGATATMFIAIAALSAAACVGPKGMSPEESKAREKVDIAGRMLQVGSFREAERVLNDALELDPRIPEAHYFMGVTRFYLGDYAAAEKSLRESLRLRPEDGDAHNTLGLVYVQMGDRDRALEEYRLALKDPVFATPEKALLNIGLCLDGMGQTEEAIRELRRSVETNPRYYPAHYELAKILDRQEQTREAIEEYEIAAPEFASDPDYHYRLGLAYFRARETVRAREHLSKVAEALPGTERAAKAKEILQLIQAQPVSPQAKPGPH